MEASPPGPPSQELTLASTRDDQGGSTATAPVRAGAKLGRYVVLEELGHGGMGVVYAAYDPELDRKVAVKIVRPKSGSFGTAGRERMVREARAMAKLTHPNVITVFDIGSLDGNVFVAMELVDGETAKAWGKRAHEWREVVEVYLAAGQGLAAAHAAGLVHRDFKPENMMIARDGRVLVMDFGLARPVEGQSEPVVMVGDQAITTSRSTDDLTRTGARVGTPAYMSPEQHLGVEADARSDQFSFCVSLYEALYGERPYAAETLAGLVLAVTDESFRPPPSGSSVPRWLRVAVLAGLTADPARRYPSMQALLERLRRGLNAGRRRGLAVAGAAAVVLVAAGTLASGADAEQVCRAELSGVAEVWDPARGDAVRSALGATGLSYAADTADGVVTRLDAYAGALTSGWVDACEATHVRHAQSEQLLDLRMACLDRSRHALSTLAELLSDADRDVAEHAVEAVEGLPDLQVCADAEALRDAVPLPDDPAERRSIAEARTELAGAVTLAEAGKYAEAREVATTLTEPVRALGYDPLVAELAFTRSRFELADGSFDTAEASLEEAAMASARAHDDRLLARVWSGMVDLVGHRRALTEEGMRYGQVARAAMERADSSPIDRAELLNGLGNVEYAAGHYAQARDYHEQALEIRERELGEEHTMVAVSLNNLGNAYDALGDYERAVELHRHAIEIRRHQLGEDHPRLGNSYTNLGNALRPLGRADEAKAAYRRSKEIAERSFGAEHPGVALALNSLGLAMRDDGELEAARELHLRAAEIWAKSQGETHPDVGYALNNAGMIDVLQGRHDDAARRFGETIEIWSKAHGPAHPDLVIPLINMGDSLLLQERAEEALHAYTRAREIAEAELPAGHQFTGYALTGVGRALLLLDRPDEAVPPLEAALGIRESEDAASPTLAETRFALAQALWSDRSRRDRAMALAEAARSGWAAGGAEQAENLALVDGWISRPGRSPRR